METPSEAPVWRRPQLWLYATPLALAAGLGLWDLGGRSFWNDEVLSLLFARQPAADILGPIDPFNPPLYFLGLKAWVALVGEREGLCRVPSVVAGLGALALTIHAARRIGGDRAGWLAGFLGALAPGPLMYERECRAYPFLLLWGIASFLGWLRLGQARARWAAWAHGGLLAMGPWIHYTAAFWFLAQGFCCVSPAARGVVPARRSLASLGVAALLLLPWALICAPAAARLAGLAAGRDLVPIGGVPVRAGYVAFGWVLGETVLPWRWHITVPALAVCLCAAWRVARAPAALRGLLCAPLVLCAIMLATLPMTSKPAPRYAALALPFVTILLGSGLSLLRSLAAPTVLFLCMGVGVANYFTGQDRHNMATLEPHHDVAADIRRHLRATDRILFVGSESAATEFYLPWENTSYISFAADEAQPLIRTGPSTESLDRWLRLPLIASSRLWLVVNSPGQDIRASTLASLQLSLPSILQHERSLEYQARYVYDAASHEKRIWVHKEFRAWRIEVYCYGSSHKSF